VAAEAAATAAAEMDGPPIREIAIPEMDGTALRCMARGVTLDPGLRVALRGMAWAMISGPVGAGRGCRRCWSEKSDEAGGGGMLVGEVR
jgi:hypothetical protein